MSDPAAGAPGAPGAPGTSGTSATSERRAPGVAGRLTVLGCDGSYPGPGGAGSGYLVEAAGVTLWLDAGPGTFAALQLVTDPDLVDAVVLSHEHPDHWSDVDAFAVWCRDRARHDGASAAPRRVPVYAPPGLREHAYFGDDPVLDWRTVEPSHRIVLRPVTRSGNGGGVPGDGGEVQGNGGGVPGRSLLCSLCATDHGPPTLAVRVDVQTDGVHSGVPVRSLAYSADTGPDWSVEELGPGIGTFLCEATFGAAEEGSARHLSGRQAGAMARAAEVGRLVLTHRRPSVPAASLRDEAAAAFGRAVEQAVPGAVFEW